MYVFAILAVICFASARSSKVFYSLSGNGIDIINPKSLQVVKRLPHDMTVPGTSKPLCTKSLRYGTPCSWGGAAVVPGKFVFIADSNGNRVLIVDVKTQEPVGSIKTNGFPYILRYIAALDEVWIHCWKNSHLDVVGNAAGVTSIQMIRNASSLLVSTSIKAQVADTYRNIMHGYFEAENCQNIKPETRYGVATHFSEPGIFKIDLVNKMKAKFINTSSYGCMSTFGLAFTSQKNYAFVQCLGVLRGQRQRKMIVVDLTTDTVIHADDAITNGATGYPYSSPDGKYILVLNKKEIISYYVGEKLRRLRTLPLPEFMPSRVAFTKTPKGYNAFVTSKRFAKVLVIMYSGNKIEGFEHIPGVGLAARFPMDKARKMRRAYLPYYLQLYGKPNQPIDEAKLEAFIKAMYYEHVTREISGGCDVNARYLATAATLDNKVAIIDARKLKDPVGLVKGVIKPRDLIWVE